MLKLIDDVEDTDESLPEFREFVFNVVWPFLEYRLPKYPERQKAAKSLVEHLGGNAGNGMFHCTRTHDAAAHTTYDADGPLAAYDLFDHLRDLH